MMMGGMPGMGMGGGMGGGMEVALLQWEDLQDYLDLQVDSIELSYCVFV